MYSLVNSRIYTFGVALKQNADYYVRNEKQIFSQGAIKYLLFVSMIAGGNLNFIFSKKISTFIEQFLFLINIITKPRTIIWLINIPLL